MFKKIYEYFKNLFEKIWNTRFVSFIWEGSCLFFDIRSPQAASSLAYYVLLTVFPVLICISILLGFVHIDIAALVSSLEGILPKPALNVVDSFLRYVRNNQSLGLFLAGLLACWFSAAAAFRTITRVFLDVYKDVNQSAFLGMVASIIFPIFLILVIGLSILVVVTGQSAVNWLIEKLPFLDEALSIWRYTKYVLLFLAFFLFIVAILNMAAPIKIPRKPTLFTSLVCSLAVAVSSALFSWFIGFSTKYSLVYGSLVSIVILLIWLYFCAQVLLLGIVFTGVWYRRHRERHEGDEA